MKLPTRKQKGELASEQEIKWTPPPPADKTDFSLDLPSQLLLSGNNMQLSIPYVPARW